MSDLKKLQELAAQAAEEGATLKNVEIAASDDGTLILKSLDGSADFEISIPEAMMLPVEDIDFSTLTIGESSSIEEPMRGWFNAYLAAMVDEGDRAALALVRKAIDKANLTVSSSFRGLALANFLTINTKPEALNRSLLAPSMIGTATGAKVLPILGLARAGNGPLSLSVSAGGSFRVSGRADEEIRVSVGRFDALHALNSQGQPLNFATAFSLPLSLTLPEKRSIHIGRNFSDTQKIGKAIVPKAWAEGDEIRMSYCPIGLASQPRAAREAFRVALKPLNVSGIDMVWGLVRNYNMSRLFDAYVASGELEDENLRKMLSQSIRSQIETMLKSI